MTNTFIIIGYSGAVGNAITNELISFNLIFVGRKKPENIKTNHQWIASDLSAEDLKSKNIPSADAAFICLGTTIKKAKTKEAFYLVDHDMVISITKKLQQSGTNNIHVVSSTGANKESGNFYLQTKGKMEQDIINLNISTLGIYRPSLLMTKRNENRIGEKLAIIFYTLFSFLFIGPLKKYKGTDVSTLARFMIFNANNQKEKLKIYENNQIIEFKN